MKKKTSILQGQKGVSFIELLIVMTLVVIVLTMNTDTFGVIFRQSRQQTQAVGAQMDRVVGLEILRTDLEHAGYGLPWAFQNPNTITYNEAADPPENSYNDCSGSAPCALPRALLSGDDVGFNNSDYLVIKSPIVGTSEPSQRWTYIVGGSARTWGSNDLETSQKIVAIRPRTAGGASKELVMDASDNFFTSYPPTGDFAVNGAVIYGVSPDTIINLRMPFNRADYYVKRPDEPEKEIPQCALFTGVLYKATVNHNGGGMNEMPLIDCVADMQVIYRLDTNNNGTIDSTVNNISGLTAQQVREQVKEVRVYIVSHEGQKDQSFKYRNSTITVGEIFGGILFGSTFNLSSTIGSGWENYRWKVSTLVVKPRNLAN
jgi:hypothetical protein